MTRTMLSSLSSQCPVLVLILALAGCVHFDRMGDVRETGEFSETLDVAGPVELDVRTGAGRIFVDTGESDRVEIFARVDARGWTSEEAFARLDAVVEDPPISRSGDRIRVGDDGETYRDVWISYDIRVPGETLVRATTGSGQIEIRGVDGDVETRTGSGGIDLEDIGGHVRAETGSGGIDARDIVGGFRGRTGSGGVTLSLIEPGDVEVRTGSGRIIIEGLDGGLRAETGSGGIEVSGDVSDGWEIVTGSGGIRLEVPDTAGFELDAYTPSGGIDLAPEFVIDAVEVDDENSRTRRLRGTVGDGGPRVDVRTNSGGIRILPMR
jgi:hypothetical protein